MNYVLDTNILVGYVRGAPYTGYIDARYGPRLAPNKVQICVVSEGEMLSLAYQFNWGPPKRAVLTALIAALPAVEVRRKRQMINLYGEIDAFSQGRHPTRSLGGGARNMGKNDLWIAATAAAQKATLITADHDFDHLNGIFFDVIYVNQALTPADA